MKRLLFLMLALLLTPQMGWGAIAIDGTPTGTISIGATPMSWSFTCTAGSVIAVSVGNLGNAAVTISSVTYNSVTLTQLFAGDNSGGVEAKLAFFMAVTGCDGAAHNVDVTASGAVVGYLAGAAAAYSGVVNSSVGAAHRTVYSGGAGGGGGSVVVVDSQNGDYVVAGIADFGGTTITGTGNPRITQRGVGASGYSHGLQDYAASGSSTSTTWTGSNFFTQMATALIPSGAGADQTFGFYKRRL